MFNVTHGKTTIESFTDMHEAFRYATKIVAEQPVKRKTTKHIAMTDTFLIVEV